MLNKLKEIEKDNLTKYSVEVKYVIDETETAKAIDLRSNLAKQGEAIRLWLEDDWNGCLRFHEKMDEIIGFGDGVREDRTFSRYLFFDSVDYGSLPQVLVKFGCAVDTELLKNTVKESRLLDNKAIYAGMLLNALKLRAKCTSDESYNGSISVYTSHLFKAVGLDALSEMRRPLQRLMGSGIIPDSQSLNQRVEAVEDSQLNFPANIGNRLVERRKSYSWYGSRDVEDTLDNLGLLEDDPRMSKWLENIMSFLNMKLAWLKTFNTEDVLRYSNIRLYEAGHSTAGKENWELLNQACQAAVAITHIEPDKLATELRHNLYTKALLNVYFNTYRTISITNLSKLDDTIEDISNGTRNFKDGSSSRKLDYRYNLFYSQDNFRARSGLIHDCTTTAREMLFERLNKSSLNKHALGSLYTTVLLSAKKPFNPYLLGLPDTPEFNSIIEQVFGTDLPEWSKPKQLCAFIGRLAPLRFREVEEFAIYRKTDAGVRLKRIIN